MKLILRSIVFVLALISIYLAFPILIVPSSLPAIQELAIGPADAAIFELEIPQEPTLKNTLTNLKIRHRLGVAIIRETLTQTAL